MGEETVEEALEVVGFGRVLPVACDAVALLGEAASLFEESEEHAAPASARNAADPRAAANRKWVMSE